MTEEIKNQPIFADAKKKKAESKRSKFVRIAENRTNKIIETIKLLGNCSNKNNYEYTEEDVKKIFGEIERELKLAKLKFQGGADGGDKKFKL